MVLGNFAPQESPWNLATAVSKNWRSWRALSFQEQRHETAPQFLFHHVLATVALLLLAVATSGATETASTEETLPNSAKSPTRMNCSAKIECITPDGREAAVASATDQKRSAPALIMADDRLSCPL